MDNAESLLSELDRYVQDGMFCENTPAYAIRINGVIRNLAGLNDSGLSELLQALREVATALQNCIDSNEFELSSSTPFRMYTGASRNNYSLCVFHYTQINLDNPHLIFQVNKYSFF